jgi:hypothetical protein
MSSTKPDKHRLALVENLKELCKEHRFTCPIASKYLDMLNTGVYTDEILDEIIELFAEPCDICRGPHSLDHCPTLQVDIQCPDCDEIFSNSRMYNEHIDEWGSCPCSIECDHCEGRHYSYDCPYEK